MTSLLRRPVLLLSAIATFAVPGTLAALAVLGHFHVTHATLGAAVSRPGNQGQQTYVLPGTTATTAPRGGPDIRLAAPGIEPDSTAPAALDRARGLSLLQEAASAGSSASYQGVEEMADTTVGGRSTVVATVWHRGGGPVIIQAPGGAPYAGDASRPYQGVFGISGAVVQLLAKHYTPLYVGSDTVDGRPAFVIEALRPGGGEAARFWLDQRTLLPLRKDVYDMSARTISDERFVRVKFGTTKTPKVGSGRGYDWTEMSSPGQVLVGLNAPHDLIPAVLPGNLGLYDAAVTSTQAGKVADFGFSDGLSDVSLFVQRGTLPAKMSGWRATTIAGRPVYVAGHEVTLSGQGFVYTMIADAPVPVVDATVSELPRDSRPGVLGRLSRGLSRLVSVLDPFR
jgi:sigma-E factor negative regulatory protein RseB